MTVLLIILLSWFQALSSSPMDYFDPDGLGSVLTYEGTSTFYAALLVADCASALTHKHDRLKDAEITITSWNGCAVVGTINGAPVSLFMDVASCPLHAKIPGKLRIRYDPSCSAIVEITNGASITTPMPPACPSPTPGASPTPQLPQSAVVVQGFVFVDDRRFPGAKVVAANNGVKIEETTSREDGFFFFSAPIPIGATLTVTSPGIQFAPQIFVQGADNYFVRGTAGATPIPSPTTLPTPSPSPTPTPIKPPLKACAVGQWCYWTWGSTQDARIAGLDNALAYGCDPKGPWVQTGSYIYCVRAR